MFFVALFIEHFCVRKFLFLSEGANIIHRWCYGKFPSLGFLGFVTSGLLNLQMGISLYFEFVADPPFFCLFACRMARGHEETSTSQVGHKRGTSRETPSVSSLVAAMSIEEFRSFSQVPIVIKLEVSYGMTTPTIGGADDVVYFTREQFSVGLRFPIPSLVNQCLHFTRAPPVLIHPNVF